MFVLYFFCALILGGCVNAFESTRAEEGYPAGFLPDCPGSRKPAMISKENLKYVEIYISGAKAPQGKRILYNYENMAKMAKDPTMDYSRRTLFYIGGYMDTADYPFGTTMEIVYKKKGYNVWILDALRFMINEYPVAVRFMPAVAEIVVDMVVNLEKANVGFDPKKVDLMGFSLGAQTMGLIGKYYRKRTGQTFSGMTAFDPSGLCFRNRKRDERLDIEDADKIVAIMTNIDNWGSAAPVAHVNFYVNGGEKQPGQVQWTKCEVGCSHFRSYFVNLAALDNDDQFIAVKCNSVQEARDNLCYRNKPLVTNVLGWNTNFSRPGIFYLPTNNIFPYFLGEKGLKKGNDAFSVYLRESNKDDIVYL